MELFFGAFRKPYHFTFLATKEIFITPKTWQMFYMKHGHLYKRKYMLNKLQMLKMVTQAMKTHILDSATAGHEDSLNWTSLVEFLKLR